MSHLNLPHAYEFKHFDIIPSIDPVLYSGKYILGEDPVYSYDC